MNASVALDQVNGIKPSSTVTKPSESAYRLLGFYGTDAYRHCPLVAKANVPNFGRVCA